MGRTKPGSRWELGVEASGGSTASHAGPGWLGALLSPHQSWGVCGHAPSTQCCPPFRPSVTVTVPFAVTASCKKAIKSACAQMLWPLCVSVPRALHVPAGIHYGPPLWDWGQDVLSPSCCGTQSPGSLSHHQLGVGVLGVNCTLLVYLSFATHSWSWEVELLGTKSFPSPNCMAAS